MNPALSQEFHLFCEQEHPQRHANTDKNPYRVYGTLKQVICLKKNLNASRPSEHPPVRGKNVKTFRWDHIRLQRQNLFMAFKRVPRWYILIVTLGQQCNIGEKPVLMLYANINRHAGTPDKTKQNIL